MTSSRLLLLATLLLCAVSASAAAPRPELRRYALLVGVNDGGRERVRLRYAGTDAEAMARVLGELGGVAPRDRTLLLDADRTRMLEALGQLRKKLEQAPEGTRTEVFFYYSGHADERGLLLKEERLGYRELRAAIDALPADVRISIVDSCASGAFARSKGGVKAPAFLMDASSMVRGHAILTSSSEDEVSQESDRIAGSYFTHHLVSGLRGAADHSRDGRVTLNEAYQYAFNETLSRTEKTQAGPQHAAYDIQLAGTGDLVMTDVRATSAGLQLAAALDGHLFVRDARGVLVLELAKSAGRTAELGLSPGTYRITRASGDQRWVADVALSDGQRTSLAEGAFRSIAREAVVTRGGPRVAEPDDHRARFFNLALVPGVSTNDVLGGPVDNALSVGIVAGRSARLSGAALSLGLNWVDGAQRGVAAAIVANIAGDAVHGAQLSVGGNWAHRELAGVQSTVGLNLAAADARWVQWAVLGNLALRDFTGLQLAVGGNHVGGTLWGLQGSVGYSWAQEQVQGLQAAVGLSGTPGDMVGAQLAVGANFVGGHARGLQLSVGPSIAAHLTGLQLALINVGGEVDGAQVGLINVGGTVRGAQVGLVNVASESDVSLGLLSFVRNGRFNLETYGSDLAPANLALKMGGRHLYSVVSVAGHAPGGQDALWSTGLGLGVHLPFAPFSVDVDLSAHQLHRYRTPGALDSLVTQLRAQMAWHLADRFAVFAGPTLNLRLLEARDPVESVGLIDPGIFGGSLQLWPGFVAGIRI